MMMSPEQLRDESSPEEYQRTLALMVAALAQAAPVLSRLGLKDDEAWGVYSAVFNALHRLGLAKVNPAPLTENEDGQPV